MTLDVQAWLTDMINSQQKIAHNAAPFCVCKPNKVPSSIKSKINEQYGESYLGDAQYVIFFKKPDGFSSKDIKKVFKLVNKALGKAANNSTISDYKKLNEDVEDTLTQTDLDDEPETPVDSPTNPSVIFVKITLK